MSQLESPIYHAETGCRRQPFRSGTPYYRLRRAQLPWPSGPSKRHQPDQYRCMCARGEHADFLELHGRRAPTCSIKTTNDSPNTVTLDLYSAFGCCSSIETIKVGNLDVCHDSNAPFHSLSEAVGANMFGWLYHIHPYTGASCSGDAGDPISLSNSAPNCYENGIAWQSFKISQTRTP